MLKCEICGEELSHYRCNLCGRYVCKKHFFKDKGICIACAESLCNVCFKHLSIGTCAICKRIVCAGCSIDIDGVRRICVYCLTRSSMEYRSLKSFQRLKLKHS